MGEETIVWQPSDKQATFLESSDDEVLYGGAAGGGKGLALDTPLPTPSGWVRMGDVRVGDELFDQAGQRCRVMVVSPISVRPCYRLTFDDGSTIVADDVHRWVTLDAADLGRLTKRDPARMARRRASRPSRATGRRSEAFSAALATRNTERAAAAALPPVIGTMRDTTEIVRTLRKTSGRTNHAIAVCGALAGTERDLPIPPYTLGAWLGDGASRNSQLTGEDPEIWQAIEADGFTVRHYAWNRFAHNILRLAPRLRAEGLLRNKHIPSSYLRASTEQRLALLRGLMDTDGHAALDGGCEFDGTNETLVRDVFELVLSLGIKATLQCGQAKLNGRVIGAKWRVKFTTTLPVFGLPRKLSRLKSESRRTQGLRYIVSCDPIEAVPTRCITVDSPTHQFLAGRAMIPTHNSDALLIDALGLQQDAIGKRKYQAILFRRTFPDLKDLIDRASEIYPEIAPGATYDKSAHVWTFPSGARIELGHLQYDSDRFKYRGRAFQWIGWDELTLFPTEVPYLYLLSRLRTVDPTIRCYVRASTNPDGPGFKWVKGYWRVPTEGTATRFVVEVHDDETDETFKRTRAFIPARLADNPHLKDSGYRQTLLSLPIEEQKALLRGRWESQTIRGAYYAAQMEKARLDSRICRIPILPNVPVNTFWDLGRSDMTAIWCHQKVGMENRFVDYLHGSKKELEHYVHTLQLKGYVLGTNYLPHDAENKTLASRGKSILDLLLEMAPNWRFEVVPRVENIVSGITQTRAVFAQCWFDEDRCADGIAALEAYRQEWDDRLGDYKATPLHDWASHGADAFRQFAQGFVGEHQAWKRSGRRNRGSGWAA